jgi:exodeoxyribonuclease VII large subunit
MNQVTLDRWNDEQKPVVLHVSELSAIISSLLTDPRLLKIWVTGEITNFKRHSSGHLYFSLSDNREKREAVISCTIWKTFARYLGFTPEDGMKVHAYGSISNYETGGRYSFQITQMRPSGAGEKALLIEQWKREMAAKGWFSPERKRLLPQYPVKIGVVTSPTGAVIKDIKNVITGRFPVEIILSPAIVQGPSAHEEIANAIRRVEKLVDLVIVGRGGGSFEDLFSFNHPTVVEAIVNCQVPVVAAIGHEIDVTLSDLAADLRASTPSHAAELSVPDRKNEHEHLNQIRRMMYQHLIQGIETADEELNNIRDRLCGPGLIRDISQRREYLADLTERMTRAETALLEMEKIYLNGLKGRLEGKNPRIILLRELPDRKYFLAELFERLQGSILVKLKEKRMELNAITGIIASHSPEALSGRGYCIIRKNNVIITSVQDLSAEDNIRIKFTDGIIDASVKEVYHDKKV